MLIHNPKLPPRAGYVETVSESGVHVYRPVTDRVSEMTEALELILSGETGEEAEDAAES